MAAKETVVLYPSFGRFDTQSDRWLVQVAGNIYREGPDGVRRRILIRFLRRVMRLPPEALKSELFRERIGGFLVHTVRGRRLSVTIGDEQFELRRPSKRSGHFREAVSIPKKAIERLKADGQIDGGWMKYEANHGESANRGQAKLIGNRGLSVISDIDDTIKKTEVADRKTMLKNTFFRPFDAIDGMSQLYQSWESLGATFHYVSSSPWQLYRPLLQLLEAKGFPLGSFHLRHVQLKDASLLRLFVSRRSTKRRMVQTLLSSFPNRKFLLVGDSGEKDPEIYGDVAKRYPDQVVAIAIRRTEGRPQTEERFEKAFVGVAPDRCFLFSGPDCLNGSFRDKIEQVARESNATPV